MRGKATIQLFDKNGKLIYKKIEHNMVTDAVKNLVNQNYIVNAITDNGGEVVNTYTPIWKDFGGLMLFKDSLDTNLIIPNKDAITGFTGNATDANHFDATNPYHGQFIANESEIRSDYCKFVFNFPLQSSLGTFSACALTSIQGGNNGLSKGNGSLFLSYSDQNLQVGDACGVGLDVPSSNFVPYVDESIDGLPIGVSDDGMLLTFDGTTIKKYEIEYKVNFTDTFYKIANLSEYQSAYGSSLDNVPMFTLNKTYTLQTTFTSNEIRKATLVDNKIYIPQLSGTTFTLNEITLGQDDVSIATYTTSITTTEAVTDYRCSNNGLWITTGDYLYIVSIGAYDNATHESTFDKIELLESDLTPLIFKDTIALLNVDNISNGDIRNLYFLTNTNILNKNTVKFSGSCDKIINFSFNFNEPVFGIITETNGIATINTNVFSAYLATINNITPIIKYATVELKVTYELYEENTTT